MRKVYFFLIILFISGSAFGQILAWQFGVPASAGNEATYTATTINGNLNTSALSRGAGINVSALGRAFSATNFTASGTKANAIATDQYFSFTVSAVAGFKVSLSTLDARLRRTGTGPNMYIWRYSTDGTTFTDIGTDISFTSIVDGVDQLQIDLSSIVALQNVVSGTTITFRLYAWGASATGGTFAIGRFGTGITTNSLAIGGSVTAATSNSTSSNIITNAGFTPTSNIDYTLYQSTNISFANSIEVAQLTIQDGGGAADGDALATTLTDISFGLTNSANIRRVALYDGSTELAEVAGGTPVIFTGLTIAAPDDGNKTFSIRVTFNSAVTDNAQFVFTVTSATADVAGSIFSTGSAGGAVSGSAGDQNRIEVTADRLAYVQNTTSPTGVSVAMAPAITISANDINGNRDLDFTSQIRITSTGTLAGTPVDVFAASGLATFPTLTHTVTGLGLTLNAERTGTLDWDVTSNSFNILTASSASDYFRSLTTGNWGVASTWESSPDNITWQSATLAPDFNANDITIRSGHIVTIAAAASADQLTIDAGGTLNHTNGIVFTINDDPSGTDMTVNGTYVINGTQPAGAGTIEIRSGGLVRVDSNLAPGESDDFGFGNLLVTYRTGSVYDWNTSAQTPSWSSRNYFTFGENTKFRFSASPNFALGGGNPTVIYGVVEANANILFQGAGTKTIKNGILGTANIDASGSTGNIIIDGGTAVLGGAGTLITPPSPGVLRVDATTVTMTSAKTVTGNILLASSYIDLGSFDLTVSENVNGGTTNAYIRTNGTGMLTLQNVTSVIRDFPVGTSTGYNLVQLSHSGAATNLSARVENGFNPSSGLFGNFGINRTWNIRGASVTPNVIASFYYYAADANAGITVPGDNLEILQYTGVAWSIVDNNRPQGGSSPYFVTSNAILSIPTTSLPFILGKTGGFILPLDCIISARSRKVNNAGIISWDINTCAEVNSFEVQRSVNGSAFQTVATIVPGTTLDYSYTDASLSKGTSLYRIKVNRSSGAIKYSNTVALLNDTKGVLITALSPNPVTSTASLIINAARAGAVSFVIYDMMGRPVKQWQSNVTEGSNTITISAREIPAGIYHLAATTADAKTVMRFVKQ